MSLDALHMRVADPAALAVFYRDVLGMSAQASGDGWRVGYAGVDADLLLLPGGGGYVHDRGHRYWKIGITLPNVDLAVAQLRQQGHDVSDPRQFLDIGYMAHLADPEGFVIELLQHDFQDNRPKDAGNPAAPFADGVIGQITLRTGDIQAEDQRCRNLGLRLLSVQDVAPYGFDLHFYAFTADQPPNADLWAVENRGWLWKRPYTTLEFQHIAGTAVTPVPEFLGIELAGQLERYP